MPIQEDNIKILASQVMDDVPEGGGAATGNEIPDGVMNNVFEDISDLDRAMGRFNLRKLFLAVRTLSTDLFGGAKTVVTALPEDPAIGYTLFTTDDPFDTREQAANRVEAYLFKGPMWHGALYENHIEGMRQIRIIQRENTEVPPRGKTLCLVQHEEDPNQIEQYVRVTEVSAEVQTFTDSSGKDFKRLIVSLDLSDPLRFDFDGHTPSPQDDYDYNTGVRLRDTTVADAMRYFGAQKLAAAAQIGDQTLRAASMFTQLVPAAQSEEPLANQTLNPELVQTIDAGSRDVDVAQQAHTLARNVTAENRRYNWIETLSPVPAPNAFSISYMAQGNWYTLTDDGEGAVSGSDPGFGTGTIDYVTGNVSLTTGALPDAGSQIIYTYGSRVHYEVRSGSDSLAVSQATIPIQLDHNPVLGGSLALSWAAGADTLTAVCDADGNITGDATGYIDPNSGEGEIHITRLPNRGSDLTIDYNWYETDDPGATVYKRQEPVPTGSTITLPDTPVAGSLALELTVTDPRKGDTVKVVARDRNGDLVVPAQEVRNTSAYRVDTEQVIGSVSGGTVTITTMDIEVKRNVWLGSTFAAGSA